MELQSDSGYFVDFLRKVSSFPALPRIWLLILEILYLVSVLPGIAFSLDLIEATNQYGVAEVLLSSFMAAFIFSVFGAQPLCIAGVTGLSKSTQNRLVIKHYRQDQSLS